MNTSEVLLSVIIVNYNGKHFLEICLYSLIHALGQISYEIIVVDNASQDGSAEFLETQFPAVRLVKSAINLGFTGGNNLGAQSAQGRYLLLLNNDTQCTNDLSALLRILDDTKIGVVGCLLTYGDGRLQLSVGYEHTPLRIVLSWLGISALFDQVHSFARMQADPAFYRLEHAAVDWVSGACLLTRRDLWLQLEGLDDEFFMYCEDVDYCRRVRDLGYRVAFSPQTTVIHYEGAGKPGIVEMALLRTARSYLIYTNKHFGSGSRMIVGVLLGLIFWLRALVYGTSNTFGTRGDMLAQKFRAYARAGGYLITRGLGLFKIQPKI